MKPTNLNKLLAAYFDESINATQKAELEELLRESEEARRRFWDEAAFQNAIRTALIKSTPDSDAAQETPGQRKTRFSRRSIVQGSIAATVLTLLLVLSIQIFTPSLEDSETALENPASIALLYSATNVRWTSEEYEAGEIFTVGTPLQFESGVVDIRFQTGAKIVIEGPAEFVVGDTDSDLPGNENNSVVMTAGTLVATVDTPESKGFAVRTPTMQLVDLGTEFGIVVGRDAATQVHVFAGETEYTVLEPGGDVGKSVPLNDGQSVQVDSKGQTSIPQPFVYSAVIRQTIDTARAESAVVRFFGKRKAKEDSLWSAPESWNQFRIPGAMDQVRFNKRNRIATLDYSAPTIKSLIVGLDESNAGLVIKDGGVLNVSGGARICDNRSSFVRVEQGGTLNVDDQIRFSRRDSGEGRRHEFEIHGNVQVTRRLKFGDEWGTDDTGQTATVMVGPTGSLTVKSLYFTSVKNVQAGETLQLVLDHGKLIIKDDVTEKLPRWIDDGFLVPAQGHSIKWTRQNGETVVSTEPMNK